MAGGEGIGVSLTPEGFSVTVRERGEIESRRPGRHQGEPAPAATITMRLVGAMLRGRGVAVDQLPGVNHYFIGNDPSKWRMNVPRYRKVVYHEAYPGIDLVFYGTESQLEYDFAVAPGANPDVIELAFDGAEAAIDAAGDLVLKTGRIEVRQRKPVLYQTRDGRRSLVAGRYVRKDDGRIGFELGPYDHTRPLVIDPVLVYRIPLSSAGITVDASGAAYVCRSVLGATEDDAVVTRINPDGTLGYSTFLGGNRRDNAYGIAADASGKVFVVGYTQSDDFASQRIGTAGVRGDAFVAKLDSSGAVVYATYLGGSNFDNAEAVAIDTLGNAYVTGETVANDFPTTPTAYQPTKTTDSFFMNAFVSVVNPTGTAVLYSTYLGGTISVRGAGWHGTEDYGFGITVDGARRIYLTGLTLSRDFPTTPGSFRPQNPTNDFDAFVAKLDPSLSGQASLVYSSFLGGAGVDEAKEVAVDAQGHAYVVGSTSSSDFFPAGTPVTIQPANRGVGDAFLAKVSPTGASLVYGTYLGGSHSDSAEGVALEPDLSAWVVGTTRSADFPLVNPIGGGNSAGSYAVFVSEVGAAGTQLTFSTYLLEAEFIGASGAAYADGALYLSGQFAAKIQDRTVELNILPTTTRWKPQRDTSTNVVVDFRGPRGLQATSTLEITDPAGVLLTGQNLAFMPPADPNADPADYKITWGGPWATGTPATYLARGDYRVVVKGVKANDSIIYSSSSDSNSTVSLVEVTGVELCQSDEAEPCVPLTTSYPGVGADNPPVGTLANQDPPQDRQGGGKRIFAEAVAPSGAPLDMVKVRATVAPTISPDPARPQSSLVVSVRFRSLDVDDPALYLPDPDADSGPVLDNRGTPKEGTVVVPTATVAPGATTARTYFRASGQPGDNYRIVASTSQQWLQSVQAVQPNPRGELNLTAQESAAVASEMLTVWRTLHLEIDSMGPPPTASADSNYAERNFIRGGQAPSAGSGKITRIDEVPEGSVLPTRLVLEPETTTPPLVLDDRSKNLSGEFRTFGCGRFEKGVIQIGTGAGAVSHPGLDGNGVDFVRKRGDEPCPGNGGKGFTIAFVLVDRTGENPMSGRVVEWVAQERRFTLSTSPNPSVYEGGRLTVAGVTWTLATIAGSQLTVVEDQPFPFHLVDDDDAAPPFAISTDRLRSSDDPVANAYAQAYVRPRYDEPNPRPEPPFNRNISRPDVQEFIAQLASGRDSSVGTATYWVMYVQGAFQGDELRDLDPKSEVFATTAAETLGLHDGYGSMIYLEAIRDAYLRSEAGTTACTAAALVHELGHQFGLDDDEGGFMGPGGCLSSPEYFTGVQLDRIRAKGVQ